MKESEGDDYSFLHLDLDRLDVECARQSGLYFSWAKRLADLKARVERAKSKKDLVVAQLKKEIRADPGKFDCPKVTEDIVESTVLLQPSYSEALKDWLRLRHDAEVVEAVVASLDHKKKMIETAVYLHGQNYYSTPKLPASAGSFRGDVEEAERAEVQRRIRKARESS